MTTASRLLACSIPLVLFCHAVHGAGLDSVAPYLKTIKKYRCVEYRYKSYQLPLPGLDADKWNGLMLIESFDTKYDFIEDNYWVRREVYIEGKSKATWNFVSYVDDEERQYIDPDCPLYRQDKSGLGGGVIKRADKEEVAYYLGIDAFLGFQELTTGLGLRKSLSDLLQSRPIKEGADGAVVIDNIFNMPTEYSYFDLEIVFDPEHDSLPRIVRAYEVLSKIGQRRLRYVWTVNEFYREPQTGLFVPVDMETEYKGKLGRRLIVDKESIVLNSIIPKDAYRVVFPPTMEVLDDIRRVMILDGKVIEKLDAKPTFFPRWSMTRILSIAGACLFVLGVLFFIYKARSANLMLISLLSLGLGGCSSNHQVLNGTFVSDSEDIPIIIPGEDGSPLLELIDGISQKYRFKSARK